MEETYYRRIRCYEGHLGDVFRIGERRPIKCPVCNQPYDTRNRQLVCTENGTVVSDEKIEDIAENISINEDIEQVQDAHLPIDEINNERVNTTTKQENSTMNIQSRGRSLGDLSGPESVNSEFELESAMMKRGRSESERNSEPPHFVSDIARMRDNSTLVADVSTKHETSLGISELSMVCGDERLNLPIGNSMIGRNSFGSEKLRANRLISRKHAIIEVGMNSITIADAKSLNGTYIDNGDGRKRVGKDKVQVYVGSKIWLANQLFEIIGE